jgi:hypothetical protein
MFIYIIYKKSAASKSVTITFVETNVICDLHLMQHGLVNLHFFDEPF